MYPIIRVVLFLLGASVEALKDGSHSESPVRWVPSRSSEKMVELDVPWYSMSPYGVRGSLVGGSRYRASG